jgi:hypothetical protein
MMASLRLSKIFVPAKTLALAQNIGACSKYRRLLKMYAAFENVHAKPLRLMKMYAAFKNVRAKPLSLMKMYAAFENVRAKPLRLM